jgi:hypothetical protein
MNPVKRIFYIPNIISNLKFFLERDALERKKLEKSAIFTEGS